MTCHHTFHRFRLKIGPRESAFVEQNSTNIYRELIAIPHSEMMKLVSPEKQALQSQWSQGRIDCGHQLGHPVVVGVFRFEEELKCESRRGRGPWPRGPAETAIGPDPSKAPV